MIISNYVWVVLWVRETTWETLVWDRSGYKFHFHCSLAMYPCANIHLTTSQDSHIKSINTVCCVEFLSNSTDKWHQMQYRCSVIHNTRFFIDSQLKKYFIIANMHFFLQSLWCYLSIKFYISHIGIIGWDSGPVVMARLFRMVPSWHSLPNYNLMLPKYTLLIFQDIFGVTSVRKWFSTPFRASIPANFTFIYLGIQGETSRIHQVVQPRTCPRWTLASGSGMTGSPLSVLQKDK